MGYQPIENYGIVGDLNTVALVGLNGSIDFLCFPQFDSPSIFAALLDDEKGGRFQIVPKFGEMKTKQMYLPDTNVLLTRFLSADGVGEIMDFMPVEGKYGGNCLVRRVTNIRGNVDYRMCCMPRLNYGRDEHTIEFVSDKEVLIKGTGGYETIIRMISTVPMKELSGDLVAEFSLMPGETADFMLIETGKWRQHRRSFKDHVTKQLFRTVNFWKKWVDQCKYKGRWMAIVNRSALVLKLLTSCKYGSMVAAPTFSLPEKVGGKRNWDYRYAWLRDGCFVVYSMMLLGYSKEAADFMRWVEKLCADIGEGNRLGIMYSIDGTRLLNESVLEGFEGYKGSSPVRIGNNAYRQLQLDIYGELLDAAYLYNKRGERISFDFWKDLEKQINWLIENWRQPDDSIWEVRGGQQHFLYSRLQCWIAVDRAIKIAESRSFPLNNNWIRTRDEIFNSIFTDFWDEEKQAFMQYPGAQTVDASVMLMPLLKFISPKDPRWLSTLKLVEKELVSDSLVYRYKTGEAAPDGLSSKEGTFSMCSFWYVECLSRAGQLEKARFYFEKMLGHANHLGLYSEQLGFEGEHLGNFPQGLSHIALISAAYNLDKQLNDVRNKNISEEI